MEKRLFELLGELRERDAGLARAADGFVIHISDVHYAMHLVTAQFEMALKQIFKDVSAEISDVRPAVNGRPTGIGGDRALGGIARLEFFDFARVGVKEAQRH